VGGKKVLVSFLDSLGGRGLRQVSLKSNSELLLSFSRGKGGFLKRGKGGGFKH